MPQFRKKPVVIEAMQYHGGNWDECARFVGPTARGAAGDYALSIQTLEGVMEAHPGDWIIRGVKGEFYPCKPDIFAATYEEVGAYVPPVRCPALIDSEGKEVFASRCVKPPHAKDEPHEPPSPPPTGGSF